MGFFNDDIVRNVIQKSNGVEQDPSVQIDQKTIIMSQTSVILRCFQEIIGVRIIQVVMTYYLRIIVHKQNVNCIKNNLTNFTQHHTCNQAMLCNGTVRKIRVRFFLGSSQHLLRLLCLIIEIKNLNCSYKTSASFITVSVKNDVSQNHTLSRIPY